MKKRFALCILLALALLMSWAAQGEGGKEAGSKVVRVGWYESAFHRTDSFGRKSGYGFRAVSLSFNKVLS